MKIAMTSVFVNDPNKAHEFYTEVLGFESKLHNPEMNLAIVVSKDDPNGTCMLLEPNHEEFARKYQLQLFSKNCQSLLLVLQIFKTSTTSWLKRESCSQNLQQKPIGAQKRYLPTPLGTLFKLFKPNKEMAGD